MLSVEVTVTKIEVLPVKLLTWGGKQRIDRGIEIVLPNGSRLLLLWLYVSPTAGPCAYWEVLAKVEPDRPHGDLMPATLHRVHPLSSPKCAGSLKEWMRLGKSDGLQDIVFKGAPGLNARTEISLSFQDAFNEAGLADSDVKKIPAPVAKSKLDD